MDDTLDDGRIEIELTSNEPAGRHRRAAQRASRALHGEPVVPPIEPPVGPPTVTDEPEPAAPPPGRNRLVGIAAGTAVAGLLVGWIAGSAGGDGDALEQATPVTTVAEAESATPPSFADDPSLVEPDEPVLTTAPERRARPAAREPVVGVETHLLALDDRLLGLPYEIVTAESSGELQFIDMASGMITIVDGPAGADTGVVFAGDGWTLLPSSSTRGEALLYDGADPTPRWIEGRSPWGAHNLPGSATLWIPDENAEMQQPGRMIEVTPEFEPTGASVEVPGAPMLLDSAGNFVVAATGGTYLASPAGISRLTAGRLVALGPTVALAEECDEQFMCKYVVIDRVSGERTDLPGLVRGAPLDPVGRWGQGGESISPDGRIALVILPRYENGILDDWGYMVSQRLASVDLATGRTTPLTDDEGFIPSVVRWTSDGQFAFFMSDGDVLAYVAATGEVLAAGPENGRPRGPTTFDVRPSDGSALLQRDGVPATTGPNPGP